MKNKTSQRLPGIRRLAAVVAVAAILLGQNASLAGSVLTETAPAEAGMSEVVLDSALDLYRGAISRGEVIGAVILVARNGKIVLHEAIGLRDREKGLSMRRDTMFRMASNTKAVVATGIAILEQRGKLAYTDLARQYLPSFDNYRSGFIQIHHLLTHTSGLRIDSLFLTPLMGPSPEHPDAPTLVLEAARIGEVGAKVMPGATYQYSNPGYNILGALVELRSGQSLYEFLRDSLYEPLGMTDSHNLETAEHLEEKLARVAAVYYEKNDGDWIAAWRPGDPPISPFPRGSGGMVSTARDYAAFCQMFLNGGEYGGARILEPETVERMTSSQTARMGIDTDEHYGYGWVIDGHVFMHGGSDGTFAWVDPGTGIVGVVLTQTPGMHRLLNQPFRELVTRAVLEPISN